MTPERVATRARRIPGLTLLWCPLALAIGLAALVLAWALKPRGADLDGAGAIAALIGSLGILIVGSAFPQSAGPDEA